MHHPSGSSKRIVRTMIFRWLPLVAITIILGARLAHRDSLLNLSAKTATDAQSTSQPTDTLRDANDLVDGDTYDSSSGGMPWTEDASHDAPPTAEALQGSKVPGNQLIIDSIISIIQHYYVSIGKTDSLSLMQGALKQIAKANHHYEVKQRGNTWHLTFDHDQRISFHLGANYSYDDLMNDILRSNAFLQVNEDATYEEPEDTSYFFLNHMLQAMDRHSALLESDNYRSLKQGTEGSFGGLGVIVSVRDHLLTVIQPIADSPAQKAGIEAGDIIVAINDFLTFGADLDQIIEKMRGKPDTDVTLTLLKGKTKAIKDVTLQRKVVKLTSAEDKLIRYQDQTMLHVKVSTFSTHTAEEITTALRKAERSTNGNLAGVILDLRDNPGGLLDQAIEVSDIFLEKGEIIITKGRETERESAKVGAYENGLPLVVLINSQSASASEIVAGALKDNERAIVIGEPSYGKGTVQTIFELPEDRALKLTIAHYLTPSRVAIQDAGVQPHLWLAKISSGEDFAPMNSIRLNSYSYHHASPEFGSSYDDVLARIPNQHRFYVPEQLPTESKDSGRDSGRKSGKKPAEHLTDPELWSSAYLLSTLKSHYDSKGYPFDYRKATWFAKVRTLLENKLVSIEQKNLAELAKVHGVQWNTPTVTEGCALEDISIRLQKQPSSQQDESRLAVTVHNGCSVPLDRISVHLKANQPGYPYEELAIGHVDAKGRTTKEMSIPLPTGELEEPFEISGVLVIDSMYTDQLSEPMRYVEEPRAKPRFATTASIKKGASSRQQTDPYTVITFNLENLSNYHMEQLEAELVNLSGGGMSVASPKATIRQLETHGKSQVSFAVMGLDLSSEGEAYLGLKIKTPYFRAPITKSVKIHGMPSRKISVVR